MFLNEIAQNNLRGDPPTDHNLQNAWHRQYRISRNLVPTYSRVIYLLDGAMLDGAMK